MYQEGHVDTVANLGSMYKSPIVMHKHQTSQVTTQKQIKVYHHQALKSLDSDKQQPTAHIDQLGATLNRQ